MMNGIWAGMVLLGIACAAVTGNGTQVTTALFDGAENAITLVLGMAGAMCFWSGFMRIADQAGLTAWLAKRFRPVLRLLFPGLSAESTAAKAICMNFSANLLGMGNAATPFGLQAMKALATETKGEISDHMVTFAVINTASLQLIPTTVAILRAQCGSTKPFAVMPHIWVTSVVTLSAALLSLDFMRRCSSAPQKQIERRRISCKSSAHGVFRL